MSATDSDNSIDWLASDDDESERESYSGGKSRESSPSSSPPPPPTTAPQSSPDESARRAKARDGSPPSCAVTWEPAAGLCKRQQGERTNPPHALKRPHGAAEEERGRDRPHPSGPPSEADRAFSRKCMELQCYIHPLSSILSGLRSGRYRERLSSFQESVAMDRIQRIMGVLRNPHMGGKYINIILKMEEMLKSWFPNVKLQDQPDVTQTEEAVPTKKLKPSPESTCPAASASDSPAAAAAAVKALRVTDLTPPAAYSASNLKWLHTSPICSPTAENLLSPRNRDLTQDNSVSSSTDGGHAKTEPLARRPPPQQQQQQQQPQQQPRPPGKINAPCLERLLKATESIIGHKGAGGLMDSSWS